eukprot:Filipodium_phascolosomae@DN1046_c0_g1_i1.p1
MSNVFDRLTDASKYGGAHKERFGEDGKGKGMAGRENVVNYTGDTQADVRDSHVKDTVGDRQHKDVVSGPLGKQKFGTQADTPISIWVYRNGDKHHAGNKIMVKKTINTMDKLITEVQKVCPSPTGAVKKLYNSDLKTTVKSLEDLTDGTKYLVCGGEKPTGKEKINPAFFS